LTTSTVRLQWLGSAGVWHEGTKDEFGPEVTLYPGREWAVAAGQKLANDGVTNRIRLIDPTTEETLEEWSRP
jgi:hypothetical protein